MVDRLASFPWKDGRPPHLPCGIGDVTANALLPGDPDRIGLTLPLFEKTRDFGRKREYRVAVGTYQSLPITLCSTGIGGPSTEIAAVELANLGVRRAIRTGGMGAIDESLPLGGFLIVEAAAGGTGAARAYGGGVEPTPASPKVVDALRRTAERMGVAYKVGRIMTTDGYYLPQSRGVSPRDEARTFQSGDAALLGYSGYDMESEALLAVGRYMQLEVGAVLGVHGHRLSDRWLEDYEQTQRNVMLLGAGALALLEAEAAGADTDVHR